MRTSKYNPEKKAALAATHFMTRDRKLFLAMRKNGSVWPNFNMLDADGAELYFYKLSEYNDSLIAHLLERKAATGSYFE